MSGRQGGKVAVIGAGFGGGVAACRLGAAGFDVHVLERGRRYARSEFPRRPDQLERLFWDPEEGSFGLFEYRSFDRTQIDVLTASGVGGGSLIYSNVLYRMPAPFFGDWPGGITRERLDPFYDRALTMLEAERYPFHREGWSYRDTAKTRALLDIAARVAADPGPRPAVRFESPHLAIKFGERPGQEVTNRQGAFQTTCVMCGECNVGCNVQAKNTVDLTYLEAARRSGATIRPHTQVVDLARDGAGWIVTLGDPRYRDWREERFDRVILAAGSLGSTRLLLKLAQRLPLSKAVGTRWSPNGDLLGLVMNTGHPVYPSQGPVITAALRFDAGMYPDGYPAALWIEDGGLPSFVALALSERLRGLGSKLDALRRVAWYLRGWFGRRAEANVGADLAPVLVASSRRLSYTLPLLAMGRDRATGRLTLDRRRRGRIDQLHLDWRARGSGLHYRRTRRAMRRVAAALGGDFVENPISALNRYISVHPLGGCPIGNSVDDGVVSADTGEVFNAPGLYVMDGSVIPGAVGPNPSLTIAALAERFCARITKEEGCR